MIRSDRRFVPIALMASLISALGLSGAPPAGASHDFPVAKSTRPGEVTVVTVNARQGENDVDDDRLVELGNRLRSSLTDPADGASWAPDVIVLNEFYYTQTPKLEAVLNANFGHLFDCSGVTGPCPYRLVGPNFGMKSKIFINVATMSVGAVKTWVDVCDSSRKYVLAHLTQLSSGKTFTVAGIHLSPRYSYEGCVSDNADELRRQVGDEVGPRIVAGDFNKRAVQERRECDPHETSGDLAWHTRMTQTTTYDDRTYVDAVRAVNTGAGYANEWTHEWPNTSTLCNGTTGHPRNRIDFIFASNSDVLQARVDVPGWPGETSGTLNAAYCSEHPHCKYSDHRFVWARIKIGIPGAPGSPSSVSATAASSDKVDVAWSDVPNQTGYRIERSQSTAPGNWSTVGTVSADVTTYRDTTATPSTTYSYRVIATNAAGDSLASKSASVTTPADKTAPTAATNLTATAGTGKVTLNWSAATDSGGSGLAGYEIWRRIGTQRYSKIATATGTTYTNSSLKRGTLYSYYVVAFDGAGNRGPASNVVSAKPL